MRSRGLINVLCGIACVFGLEGAAPIVLTGEPGVLAQYTQASVGPSGYIEGVDWTGPHVWITVRSDAGDGAVWKFDVGTPKALIAGGWDKLLVPKARVWVNGRLAAGASREGAVARMVLASPEANILDGHKGPLTDDDLVAFANQPWSKRFWMHQKLALGEHNGVAVIADFPCGDICPDYTNRVISYAVRPGPDCERVGGVNQQLILMSGSVGTICAPKVLIDRGLQVTDERRRLRQ